MRRINLTLALTAMAVLVSVGARPVVAQEKREIEELQAVAEEAYLYGFPMIVGYDVMHSFFIDRSSAQFKAPINQINNEARVFTPKDTAISTPNSDTPYSMALLDLCAEPMVLCMPEIEKARYYDVQLVDLYIYAISERDGVDFNLAYIPSTFRTPHTSEFDTAYMRQLFDFGYGMAEAGYPWAKRPPILVSGEGDVPPESPNP